MTSWEENSFVSPGSTQDLVTSVPHPSSCWHWSPAAGKHKSFTWLFAATVLAVHTEHLRSQQQLAYFLQSSGKVYEVRAMPRYDNSSGLPQALTPVLLYGDNMPLKKIPCYQVLLVPFKSNRSTTSLLKTTDLVRFEHFYDWHSDLSQLTRL